MHPGESGGGDHRFDRAARPGRLAHLAPTRTRPSVPDSRPDVHCAARSHRRRRRDHPVELPDRARDAVDRTGSRARQRGGAEERSEHAGEWRRDHRPRVRGSRAPRGRPARARRRSRGGAGDRRGSEHPDDLVHRVDEDRACRRRGRRPRPEAHRARARRQQPADRARGRGSRGSVVGRRLGLLPPPGPDLPGGEPAPGARVDRGGLPRGARGACRAPADREPRDDRGRAGPDHQREAGRTSAADRRRDGRGGRVGTRLRHARRALLSRDGAA